MKNKLKQKLNNAVTLSDSQMKRVLGGQENSGECGTKHSKAQCTGKCDDGHSNCVWVEKGPKANTCCCPVVKVGGDETIGTIIGD